jgi:16S rRNA (guanine527-N7)-methyltransferase
MMNQKEFVYKCENCFKDNGLERFCESTTLDTLYRMVDNMLRVNAVMNLTAITDEDEIIVKHLADSLSAAAYIPVGAKVLDVGCGGGFPSLPLAIARPDLDITALDSTAKKTQYVASAAELLGLSNLKILTGRAEDLAQDVKYREKFDLAVARAVASLPILCELCLPFVKVGGDMLAMKARLDESETTKAPELLGATPFERHAFELKSSRETDSRLLLVSHKIRSTPDEYPRPYAKIKSRPLGMK